MTGEPEFGIHPLAVFEQGREGFREYPNSGAMAPRMHLRLLEALIQVASSCI
jgi:hypothetical protein